MKFSSIAILAAMLLASTAALADDGDVVIENDYLKMTVSPIGARITSLYDKLHSREAVYNLPNQGGLNVVRFGQALNVNDQKDHYRLESKKLPKGSQQVIATVDCKGTDDKPGTCVITKEYLLPAGSSCIKLALRIDNTGAGEIGLIPWVWNLYSRGTKHLTEDAFMNTHGAYVYGKPLPDRRNQMPPFDLHYFPAANWTSTTFLPLEDATDTMAMVTRPEDMLKVYNWHRESEKFSTQELIGAPIFAAPGKTARWDYNLAMAAAIQNVVYCSPDLVVGVSPHPTWLSASDKQLKLAFSSTAALDGIEVHAKVVPFGQADGPVVDFTLPKLSPQAAVSHDLPVSLADKQCYQLKLTFTRNGQAYYPGDAVGDRAEVIVPLIVGQQDEVPALFPDRTKRDGRLRHLEPQQRTGKVAYSSDDFDAFAYPASSRVFKQDTFEPAGKGPLQLSACAGEYESVQVVLTPKAKMPAKYAVAGSALTGPGGQKVTCESVNDFIYVPVKMPSQYNALYRLGDYPEALQPTSKITLETEGNHPLFITYRVPAGTKPGLYRGSVTMTQGSVRHEIPVEMKVWDIELPKRSKWMDFAASLKGDTLDARHPDGTPLTRKEQLDAIVDMHLRYRITPCDSGLGNLLLKGDYAAFDKEMQRFVDAGATKIFLGNVPLVLKAAGPRLPEIEKHLETRGWTSYFYARPGFDEASSDKIPEIKALCQQWKKVSKIPLMETYYNDEPKELYGWLDIYSRNFPVQPWMLERRKAGDTFWKVNAMPGSLEPEPWESARKRYVAMWDNYFTGSYTWSVKFWSGVNKWGEDYWCDAGVGTLNAVLMWPTEHGILSTIRLEAMRDGLEDNCMLWMLREKVDALAGKTPADATAAAALDDARKLCSSGSVADQIKSGDDADRLHQRVGDLLSALQNVH